MEHYFSKLQRTIKENWSEKALSNFNGEDFTFESLAVNIEKFHILFDRTGIKPGDKIAICAKNSARWAVAYLAASTYNAVVVPILCDFMPESITNLTDHSESTLLFTDKDIWNKLNIESMPMLKAAINVQDFSILYSCDDKANEAYANLEMTFQKSYPMGYSRENVVFPTDNSEELAVINYTSGTTSAPKGVMLLHKSFTAMVEFAQSRIKASNEDSLVSMLPMAHMYGLAFELIYPLFSGVHIFYLGKTPSPSLLLKAMKSVKPYMVITVPLVMEKVYRSSLKPALSTTSMKFLTRIPIVNAFIYKKVGKKLIEAFGGNCKYFIMGGAALNPEVEKVFKKIRIPYLVGYGMTEACPLLAYEDPDKYVPGSCGKPISCADVRIDSEDPLHIAGEIQAKGDNICVGYYRNPEANAMAFTEDGYLKTGDLGVFDAQGNLFIKGRSKSMILSANGQNIYPEEVEAIVNNLPYVAESVVLDRASRIVALVYLDRDAIKKDKLDEETISDIPEQIRLGANRMLPGYSQISKVEVMLAPFEKTPKMSIKRFLYK